MYSLSPIPLLLFFLKHIQTKLPCPLFHIKSPATLTLFSSVAHSQSCSYLSHQWHLKQQIIVASSRHFLPLPSGTTHSWLCPSSLTKFLLILRGWLLIFSHTQDVGDPRALSLVFLSTHIPLVSSSKLKGLIAMYMPKIPKILPRDQPLLWTAHSHPAAHCKRCHNLNMSQSELLVFLPQSVHKHSSPSWLMATPSFQVLRPAPGIHF